MKINIDKTPLVLVFYDFVRLYLENGDKRRIGELTLYGNIGLWARKVRDGKLSWEATEENLKLLDRCVNNSKSVDDDTWADTREDFIIAAFKDLSTFRDPEAMVLFEKLRSTLQVDDGELILWPSKIKERADGSAIVVLHVSNLEAFEARMNKELGSGILRDGLMLFSK